MAAIQANHVVVTHRLAHRYGRGQQFFWRIWLSNLTQSAMHRSDEVRKLTSADSMMSQVAPDDFRSENWIDALIVHDSLRGIFFGTSIMYLITNVEDSK